MRFSFPSFSLKQLQKIGGIVFILLTGARLLLFYTQYQKELEAQFSFIWLFFLGSAAMIIFLPTLFSQNVRALIIFSIIILVYFCHAVIHIFLAYPLNVFSTMEASLEVILFIVLFLCMKKIQAAKAALKKSS